MRRTGAVLSRATAAASPSVASSVVPLASARSPARWIVAPSASGSENGTPTSRTSAPAWSAARARRVLVARSGSPAMRYATRTSRRSVRARANTVAMRSSPLAGPPSAAVTRVELLIAAHRRGLGASRLHRREDRVEILVAASGEAERDDGVRTELAGERGKFRDRVRRPERGDDALGLAQDPEAVQRFCIGARHVADATGLAQIRVLRSDPRVVEAGGHRVRLA